MIDSSVEQRAGQRTMAQPIERAATAPRRFRHLSTVGWYVILTVLAVLFVFPFLWMLSTSLRVPDQGLSWPPQWIPRPITFENYQNLFTGRVARFLPFLTFIFHSAYIAITVVVGRLIFCSAAGFAFARMRFPGSSLAFGMLMASLLLPSVVMIIPLYSLYTEIGWIDTHWPLIVPAIFANTFGVFLFRQFFMTLPMDLDDAARIDGASFFRIFWEIALPQSKPIMATLAIFSFQASWNDFQTAMIYITSLSKQTLPVGLQAFNQQYNTDYSMLMAGSMIAILPILAIFLAFQRYFVQGISLTGIRG